MTRGKGVLSAVLIVISLPLAVAAIEAAAFHARNRNNGSIVVDGKPRQYLLHVPPRYHGTKATPLVISLHGAGGWPTQQMEMSGWNRLAVQQTFIVVYPSGADAGGPRIWHVGEGPGLTNDVKFISKLIDKLEATYNIDAARIYINGLSNGGGMSFVLSCTLAGRIAAVGTVAAAQLTPWSWCTDLRPVPMIAFHGTDDPMAPYHGGPSWVSSSPFADVPTWTMRWARRNHCRPDPIQTTVAPDTIRREYTRCANGASVVLYTIVGGGHTWPGGEPLPEWFAGRTTNSIDATRLMWAFFREHPLRRRSAW